MNNLIEAHAVSKKFGDFTALNNVSISVPKGSIFGLLGPNGAGKTTLIRVINQITMPDAGHVILDNEPLQPQHIKDIGYLPEERGLYKSMKVGEQALYLAQLKGEKTAAQEAAEAIDDETESLDEIIFEADIEKINIRSPQMSVNKLTSATIKQIPVVLGEADIIKSLILLPGVTSSG